MYDKYLKYAGVDLKEARIPENKELPETKAGFEMEDAETDTGTMSDAGGKEKADDADFQIPKGQDEIYDGNQYRGKMKSQEEQKELEKNEQDTVESSFEDIQPESQRSELKALSSSDDARKEVRQFEGFESRLYEDASGHCTIGFGHKLHDGVCTQEDTKKYGNGITEEKAMKLFDEDMASAESTVKDMVKVPLNNNEFESLSSFVYNIGPGNFKTSTLLKKLNKKNYDSVSGEMKRWVYTTDSKTGKKVRNNGLINRRKKEVGRFREKGKSNE
jgi:GH24 family phage-related lysozyme (muramidase)